jgi:HEAT repeat protein
VLEPVARAAALAALGHRTSLTPAEIEGLRDACAHDSDGRVRAAALAALVHAAPECAPDLWLSAVADESVVVRRRAAELAPTLARPDTADDLVPRLLSLLADRDVTVVESAAWALGELGDLGAAAEGAVAALADVVDHHRDPLAREAAVAALGSRGDPRGLAAILGACSDKPAVRRRAVLALAPFEGIEVDAAIDAALSDRDWQVRQAAEDLRTI